ADRIEVRAVGLHDADVQRAAPERLTLSARGPEVRAVRRADEQVERAARGRVSPDDRARDRGNDEDAEEVDEDREGTRPPAGLLRRGPFTRRRRRHLTPF